MKCETPRMAWIAGMLLACSPLTLAANESSTELVGPPAEYEGSVLSVDDDLWDSTDIAPEMETRLLHRDGSSSESEADADAPRRNSAWGRTTLALAGVVGLIFLLGWGYRVVTSGGRLSAALGGTRNQLIQVVSRTPLAPRQSLCLVRVGPRLILLGMTSDSVRALDVISDPALAAQLLGQVAQGQPNSHTAEFSRCLDQEAHHYREDDPIDETLTPEESRISAVKEKLAGTIERLRRGA